MEGDVGEEDQEEDEGMGGRNGDRREGREVIGRHVMSVTYPSTPELSTPDRRIGLVPQE